MKKIVSLILVLCMLATGCLTFSSCAKVKTKDIEKNPQAALSEAMKNTTSDFFTDDANIGQVIKKSLEEGSLVVAFEGDEEMIGEDLSVLETIYFNKTDKKYVSDTAVTIGQETINARIFLDKTGIALNSNSILGTDKTLAVNVATLASKFKDSALRDMIFSSGETEEEVEQVVQILETLKNEYEAMFSDTAEEDLTEEINEIYALMNQTISEETIETLDGKDTKCVVASYTVKNNTIEDLTEKLLEKANLTGEMKTDIEATLNSMISELNETAKVKLTYKVYIDKKTNKTVKQALNGTVEMLDSASSKGTIKGEILYGETEIKLTVKVDVADIKANVNVKLTKEEKNGSVIYKLALDASDGNGASVNYLNAKYTYTKKTGAIKITADVYGEDERLNITLNGSIISAKNSAKIEFSSLTIGEDTYNFKISLTFNASATMPARPEDAKDIMELTEDEWEKIVEDIAESKLGNLIG